MRGILCGAAAIALLTACGHSPVEMQAKTAEAAKLQAEIQAEQQVANDLDKQIADKKRGGQP
jgi:hypothetical protein